MYVCVIYVCNICMCDVCMYICVMYVCFYENIFNDTLNTFCIGSGSIFMTNNVVTPLTRESEM